MSSDIIYVINSEDSEVIYSTRSLDNLKTWIEKASMEMKRTWPALKSDSRTKRIVKILDMLPVLKIVIEHDYRNDDCFACSSREKLKISDIYDTTDYDPADVKYVENAENFRYYADYEYEDDCDSDCDSEEELYEDYEAHALSLAYESPKACISNKRCKIEEK
jgi:hypothetical protein